jgi:hypothetical protein
VQVALQVQEGEENKKIKEVSTDRSTSNSGSGVGAAAMSSSSPTLSTLEN